MSYSLYQASVPTFTRSLNAFLAVLDKAEAHAAAAKFDPQIYLTLRLRPDMYAFARQVQAFCDHAKIAPHRVAGLEPPRFEDTEATLDELRARIRRTLDVIAKIDAKAIDAGAEREVAVPIGGGRKAMMTGGELLDAFRAAELLLPSRHRLRHPALRRRADRQARLSRRAAERHDRLKSFFEGSIS